MLLPKLSNVLYVMYSTSLEKRTRFMLYIFCLVLGNFTHIFQGYFTGFGAIVWLPQSQWNNPEGYA